VTSIVWTMPRTGRPPKHIGCSVDGCERKHGALGLCFMHYKRLTRTGELRGAEAMEKKPNLGPCRVKVCERPAITKGLCEGHYQRMRSNGDLTTPIGSRAARGAGGRWIDRNGYVILTIPEQGHRRVAEHRHVMEQALGRRLLDDESVHHKNGDRADNRVENLELWTKSHPSGQRVEDKLAWAREILALYDNLPGGDHGRSSTA
jgi:hypothetical protein